MQSARQEIVDLILHMLHSEPPVVINALQEPARARLAAQLLVDGYLHGPEPARGGGGTLLNVVILDVTIEGRRLCDTLEGEIRNSQFSVRAGQTLKKGTIIMLSGAWGVFGGVVGALIIELVFRKFHLK